uniref:Uncharacterized protein n=1 Tax=Ostreococcus sp. 'lucimarinus' TaxID=242159 RepID=A0A7R9T2S1_9CHLO
MFSGSRRARARPGLADDVSRASGRGDGGFARATSDGGDDAFANDPREDGDDGDAPCDAPRRVREVREGAASATPTRVWDEYVLRGNDLPQTEYACEGASRREYTRFLTWKTTCVPAVKAPFIKSFLECMPDLRYVFFTDKGIAKFLDEYAKESGIEGMDEAVRKMNSSRSNHGLKLAEMSRPLLLEKFGGLAFDLDVECKKSWRPILSEFEALMVLEPGDESRGGIYQHFDSSKPDVISPLLADFSSKIDVLSSVMAAGKPHSDFFRELAAFMARTVNDAHFQVEINPVVNIGPVFHYSFLEHWFAHKPPRAKGAAVASYLLHFANCSACLGVHHGGCTWCDENFEPKGDACVDIREILPGDKLTIMDG